MRKKDLELLLEKIRKPKKIKVNLEQYITPANIASDILWTAFYNGDIENKIVIDLGCGTGIFSIGSALLNAKRVIGIDIDKELVEIAKNEAKRFGLKIEFLVMDIDEFNEKGDTVIMNPPFGAQFSNRRADRKFIKKAMELCRTFYSLHLKETIEFIRNIIKRNNWKICMEKEYKFPLKASLPFHEKKIAYYDVVMVMAKSKHFSNYKSN